MRLPERWRHGHRCLRRLWHEDKAVPHEGNTRSLTALPLRQTCCLFCRISSNKYTCMLRLQATPDQGATWHLLLPAVD